MDKYTAAQTATSLGDDAMSAVAAYGYGSPQAEVALSAAVVVTNTAELFGCTPADYDAARRA